MHGQRKSQLHASMYRPFAVQVAIDALLVRTFTRRPGEVKVRPATSASTHGSATDKPWAMGRCRDAVPGAPDRLPHWTSLAHRTRDRRARHASRMAESWPRTRLDREHAGPRRLSPRRGA